MESTNAYAMRLCNVYQGLNSHICYENFIYKHNENQALQMNMPQLPDMDFVFDSNIEKSERKFGRRFIDMLKMRVG